MKDTPKWFGLKPSFLHHLLLPKANNFVTDRGTGTVKMAKRSKWHGQGTSQANLTPEENNAQLQSHLVSIDLGIELGSIIKLLITVYFN